MVGLSAIVLLAAPAWAAVQLQVASQDLVVGQQVELRISADGDQQPVQPELAVPEGLRLQVAGAPSYSTSFSFDGQKSRRSATWTWTYALTALEQGRYSLGPATLGTQSSQAVEIRVAEGLDTEMERLQAGFGLFQAYVGQTLVWRASFDTKLRGQSEHWTLPPLPGLDRDPLADDQTQTLVSALNGQRVVGYRAAMALRVSEAGEIPGSATTLSLQIPVRNQGRVERSRQVFTSAPEPLILLPMPEGQDGRWSGLVGTFEATLVPERTELALGETLSLTLKVVGDGSVAGWLPPVLKLEDLKVFAELPKLRGEITSEGYLGRGERSFAVAPEQAGVLEIPAMELQVLDPSTGTYQVVRTQPVSVRVLDGPALEPKRQSFQAALPAAAGPAPERLPRDPMGRAQLFAWTQPGVLLALFAPVLALLGVVVVQRPEPPQSAGPDFLAELADLGPEDLAGAQALLRKVQQARGLAPEHIPSDPTLWADLQAARFGGGEPASLLARVRAAVAARVGAA